MVLCAQGFSWLGDTVCQGTQGGKTLECLLLGRLLAVRAISVAHWAVAGSLGTKQCPSLSSVSCLLSALSSGQVPFPLSTLEASR